MGRTHNSATRSLPIYLPWDTIVQTGMEMGAIAAGVFDMRLNMSSTIHAMRFLDMVDMVVRVFKFVQMIDLR